MQLPCLKQISLGDHSFVLCVMHGTCCPSSISSRLAWHALQHALKPVCITFQHLAGSVQVCVACRAGVLTSILSLR
jgi:hypothetical protein